MMSQPYQAEIVALLFSPHRRVGEVLHCTERFAAQKAASPPFSVAAVTIWAAGGAFRATFVPLKWKNGGFLGTLLSALANYAYICNQNNIK